MGKIISFTNKKGGVGKTTTTLNLAHSLQSMGKKVLTIDFDSQANLTTCYGVENTNDLESLGFISGCSGKPGSFYSEQGWCRFHSFINLSVGGRCEAQNGNGS